MSSKNNLSVVPPGWEGGFAESNSDFAYPNPDLSSLPMLCNMANINLLQRQQAVKWPEFSWLTNKGHADPGRCFQMFAPNISRIGYNNRGRVYSIICPQQGVWIDDKVCLNAEITVTGQRGWVKEPKGKLAADMTVEGKIWFSPKQGTVGQLIWPLLEKSYHDFPLDKAHAIKVKTHHLGDPDRPIFPVRDGETSRFESPEFARHEDEAYTVGNVEVEIGEVKKTYDPVVDEFNKIIMTGFNLASGNMLQYGNILSWNVWFAEPQLVNREEWRTHAERWRKSIDAHHGYPDGPGTKAKYFDGTPFNAKQHALDEAIADIISYLEKHFGDLSNYLKCL
ncbi:hypothetical protein [Fodinibius salsisoli]|uniref:Uncharacterized protein n=1 Tax=Fodinibius salsisoli TaxID=2820877 RepID=A0ABT3PRH5_9BACT|nr:hypothetical protein [Fodinibius salsisoli]MCW9708431.1 hypothetical protein [Fodinibius salsisoli]